MFLDLIHFFHIQALRGAFQFTMGQWLNVSLICYAQNCVLKRGGGEGEG